MSAKQIDADDWCHVFILVYQNVKKKIICCKKRKLLRSISFLYLVCVFCTHTQVAIWIIPEYLLPQNNDIDFLILSDFMMQFGMMHWGRTVYYEKCHLSKKQTYSCAFLSAFYTLSLFYTLSEMLRNFWNAIWVVSSSYISLKSDIKTPMNKVWCLFHRNQIRCALARKFTQLWR